MCRLCVNLSPDQLEWIERQRAGRHARPYDELVAMLDRRELRRQERLGVTYAGRHRRDDDG